MCTTVTAHTRILTATINLRRTRRDWGAGVFTPPTRVSIHSPLQREDDGFVPPSPAAFRFSASHSSAYARGSAGSKLYSDSQSSMHFRLHDYITLWKSDYTVMYIFGDSLLSTRRKNLDLGMGDSCCKISILGMILNRTLTHQNRLILSKIDS